jgi:thiol-disulfide isomerase/thioredoxin
MTDQNRQLLSANAESIAGLPADDPLREALVESGLDKGHDLDAGAVDAKELQESLADVALPDFEGRLLSIPDEIEAGRRNPWKAASFVMLAAAAVFAFLWLRPGDSQLGTGSPSMIEAAQPELVAVKFWHRTCPACREIDPRYAEVKREFEAQPVLFVTFDMSTEESRAQSKMLAETLGIGDLYQDNYGVTGFVVLVDPETRQEVARLTSKDDTTSMKSILADSIVRPQS